LIFADICFAKVAQKFIADCLDSASLARRTEEAPAQQQANKCAKDHHHSSGIFWTGIVFHSCQNFLGLIFGVDGIQSRGKQ